MSVAHLAYRPFTIEEYRRLADMGILRPDEKVELLHGQIVPMSPIGRFHNAYVNILIDILHPISSADFILQVQGPIQLAHFSEPEPDLALLHRQPDFYASHIPLVGDIALLIEVADSSLEKDKSIKIPIYAQAGILEVWIVNIVQQQLTIYREPQGDTYQVIRTLFPSDTATLPNGNTLALNRLFL